MNGSQAMAQHWLATWTMEMSGQIFPDHALEILICPPASHLFLFAERNAADKNAVINLRLGAQNLGAYAQGAYTGEISGAMLIDCQCSYVLVGHSERRQLFMESDDLIAQKVEAAQSVGLRPILCVGETRLEREQQATESVIAIQLDAVLQRISAKNMAQAIIAYEPIWAIGTGLSATPEQAQAVQNFIRQWLSDRNVRATPILYGGSVSPENVSSLLQQPDIDGVLVGGASLDAKVFARICRQAVDSVSI